MPHLARSLVFAALLASHTLAQSVTDTTPPDGPRRNTPSRAAFVNAKIVTAPGKVIEKGTLVIDRGRIIAIGTDIAIPATARKIDCEGKTIYAGFIDAYGELPIESSKLDPALAELTGAKHWNALIVPQLKAEHIFKVDAKANDAWRSQGVVARYLAPSYGIMKGEGVLVTTGDATAEKAILAGRVAQHISLTPPRGPERGYPTSPMGAYAIVRQTLLDSDWYARAEAAEVSDVSLPGIDTNDALAAVARETKDNTPLMIDGLDELYTLRALMLSGEFKRSIILRGVGFEYRVADQLAQSGVPVIIPLAFTRAPDVSSVARARNVSLEDLMAWDLSPENPKRLAKANIAFSFSGTGLRTPGEFLGNLRKAVERGLDKDVALAALTTNPAKLYALDKTLGSLEAGKSASFVITSGDLFDKETRVLSTWVAGVESQVVAPPTVEARGTWTFNFSEQTTPVKIKFSGQPTRIGGTIVEPTSTTQPTTRLSETSLASETSRDREGAGTTQPAAGGDASAVARVEATQPATSPSSQPRSARGRRGGSGPEPTRTGRVDLTASTLSFTLPGKSFHVEGTVLVSGQIMGEEFIGSALMPDGSRVAVRGNLTDKTIDTTPARGEGEPATQPATQPTTQPGTTTSSTTTGTTTAASTQPAASFEPLWPPSAYGRDHAVPQPKKVLFKNATVWTSAAAGNLAETSVLVVDGKISAIGKDLDATDAIVIDATGKHLTAGLIDCHSHIATDGGVNESGQAVTCEVRIGDFVDPTDISIYRQLAGGLTAANVLHGSANPIGGQNQVIKLRWGAWPEALKFEDSFPGVKFALGENVKQSNWGDRYTTRYPQSRMGVEQIMLDAFRSAKDYERNWNDYTADPKGKLPPRRDLELEALVEIVNSKRMVHCHSYRQDEILALMRTAETVGFKIDVFQHILEGYKVADVMARHGAMASTFSDWWAYKLEVIDAIPYNGAIMQQAGLIVSFNSDDGELARRMYGEAAKAVKYGGVSEADALKFVTINPAIQLRIDKRVGSIEVGKDADLALWSRSPLDSFTRCEQTWIDGKCYFSLDEDTKLRERDLKMRSVLIQKLLASGEQRPGVEGGEEGPRPQRELWPRVDLFCTHSENAR